MMLLPCTEWWHRTRGIRRQARVSTIISISTGKTLSKRQEFTIWQVKWLARSFGQSFYFAAHTWWLHGPDGENAAPARRRNRAHTRKGMKAYTENLSYNKVCSFHIHFLFKEFVHLSPPPTPSVVFIRFVIYSLLARSLRPRASVHSCVSHVTVEKKKIPFTLELKRAAKLTTCTPRIDSSAVPPLYRRTE